MRRLFSFLACAIFLAAPSSSQGARIKGTVTRKTVKQTLPKLGLTVSQIAPPAKAFASYAEDVAVFLRVKDSLTLKKPEPPKISVKGLTFAPTMAACAVDDNVVFVNEGSAPMTIHIGKTKIGAIAPGSELVYSCTALTTSEAFEVREVTVEEWPHMRASIYVGEVGVAAMPDEAGRFELRAPKGEYVLEIVGHSGVLETREVNVENPRDLDIGVVDLRPEDERTEEAVAPPPPPPPRRPAPPPPAVDDEEDEEEEP